MADEKCSVPACGNAATVEVRLYDFYPDGTIFDKQDYICPFLCAHHVMENESGAKGERKPRGIVEYPHSNKQAALGFTYYRWLGA
jgi:hypothetical protein